MITLKIYTLTNPLTKQVFYIGKTQNLIGRLQQHINASRTGKSQKDAIIFDIISNGCCPIINEIDSVDCVYQEDEDRVSELEAYWMQQFKCWGFDITNVVGIEYPQTKHRPFKNKLKENWVTQVIRIMESHYDECLRLKNDIKNDSSLSEYERKKLLLMVKFKYSNLISFVYKEVGMDDSDLIYVPTEADMVLIAEDPSIPFAGMPIDIQNN